ncbi:MAG: Amuc_1100 family pilus-like protein [Verrucomicrobia bacterium]|nr:Amuc_1100 family pilus-like protein [Verrucomicrobiota bacterium]
MIGLAVAVLLIGGAGYFAFLQYNSFTQSQQTLQSERSTWEGLETKSPHPGTPNLDNIRSATNDLARVQQLFDTTQRLFRPVPPITISNAFDLNIAVNRTISSLNKQASLYGVTVPNSYNFTFRGQKEVIDFKSKGSIPKFAYHLNNVEKLVQAVYNARVHSLESIKRVRVDETDENSFGIMQNLGMTQDEFLLYTPYEISFKGFSSELASVLENLTNSEDVYIVKAMNVEPTDLPVRPQENRRNFSRQMTMPPQGLPNPYGQAGPYGTTNPYGTGNPYGLGRPGEMANTYGSGAAGQYGASGNPTPSMGDPYGGQYGASPFGGQYGGASGNPAPPMGGQYGGQYGANPYGGQYGNPYGMGPMQPQIMTRQKETSEKYVISENPLLFEVQVHLVQYFEDAELAAALLSVAEEGSGSSEDEDSGYSSSGRSGGDDE